MLTSPQRKKQSKHKKKYELQTSASTSEAAASDFNFMPTPGIIPADMYTTDGPEPNLQPAGMTNANLSELMNEVQTQSFSFDNMIDDLQQMQEDEQVRMNSKRAKKTRVVRG
ncbi:Uncharacterized protein Fot_26119 [Forsythia ovata]|uniref:Uncharacterized protein n=1 Tax=Forsythia ovata TaxID=205694 RepID=A0ABD1UAZ7_9LAMI